MNKNKVDKKVIKMIIKYIGEYKILLGISLICAIGFVVLSLYTPILIGEGIDLIVKKGDVKFSQLVIIIKKLGLVIFASGCFQWIMGLCNNKITYQVVKRMREDAFDKLLKLPIKYIDSHMHGDVVSRIINDIDQFSDGLLMGFSQLFTSIFTIIVTLIFMLIVNYKIAFVVVVITPLSLLVASFIAKKTYMMFRKQGATRGELTSFINEMIDNQKVVKAFGHEKENQERFNQINQELKTSSLKATFFSSITNPSTRFINGLVYTSVGILGGIIVIYNGMSIGQLSSFLIYANQYTKPFNELSSVIAELQNALVCAGRVYDLLAASEDDNLLGKAELPKIEGIVEFKHVEFSYDKDTTLIKDLNINIKKGMKVAIVGPTGCGKSTIINLLLGFYQVDKGIIEIDGYDINHISVENLRKNIKMVLQETWIKTASVADNIAYGKPQATREEIIQAAKLAHAHSFIIKLSKGYDTIISDEGDGLSQGQKQLISIGRLMLDLPPILILDEATSSIDSRTELKIQHAFSLMMEGRTSFIVAHRLSTIKEADLILVMDKGSIVEQGTHNELMGKKGFYSNLYHSQFAG